MKWYTQPTHTVPDTAIIPNERVGAYSLGTAWSNLQRVLPHEQDIEQRHQCFVVKVPDIWFFIDSTSQELSQITVLNAFQGKIAERIGIGSTLRDVKRYLGRFRPNQDTGYIVPKYPGVCFDLAFPVFESETYDLDDTIAYISVYKD